jgi:hypothetical protein
MSKKFSKSGKKKSLGHGHLQGDDEFALDLAGSSAPPAKVKRITINDDEDEAPPERCVLAVRKPDTETKYPCGDCYRQLHREVEAKLQSRTLTTTTVEFLKLIPHFTADELVDTLVDLLAPPTASVSLLTSPSRVHIKDGDVEWQPLKFPIDIGYFSGTSLETSVEPWWIPRVSLAYNVSSGIVGCTLCKLQSTLSKAAVNVFHFTPFLTYSYLH